MIITDLENCDLVVDQVYGGSRNGNASDDPLPRLLQVDNSAGFRHRGKRSSINTLEMLVLVTGFDDLNWPDSLDKETGTFIYFGDNRKSQDLRATGRQGNLILEHLFTETHTKPKSHHFPPIFIFSKTKHYRDMQFLGLAVPGTETFTSNDDLVAVWRIGKDGKRFLNYKAVFTILDIPSISRDWIKDIQEGKIVNSKHAPKVWKNWVLGRKYTPLKATPLQEIRTQKEQTDLSPFQKKIIEMIYTRYKKRPTDFETVAKNILYMGLPNSKNIEVTRPTRDGGRDAVGTYRIFGSSGGIDIDFSMEAKCYKLSNGVGVKELSRLISRLRYRQFGVLITTSYLRKQAYEELKEDQHPVIIISAKDIADLLESKLGTLESIRSWLDKLEKSN